VLEQSEHVSGGIEVSVDPFVVAIDIGARLQSPGCKGADARGNLVKTISRRQIQCFFDYFTVSAIGVVFCAKLDVVG